MAGARWAGQSFRAPLFGCGEGASFEGLMARRQLVFLQVQKATLGSGGRCPQARSVLQGPAVWLWRRRRFWRSDGSKTASFLAGSESNVRQWWPLPAGAVRPSGPCCLAVAKAPFLKV